MRNRSAGSESVNSGVTIRWPVYALWLAAIVSVVDAVRLGLWFWLPGHLFEGHTSGVWATLASDASQGELYRPLLDSRGYGGTRYMPLFFLIHGLLIRFTDCLVETGLGWMQLSAFLIVIALYRLLRLQGSDPSIAVPLSLMFLGSLTYQRLSVQLRCDFLAAALVLWAVLSVEKYVKQAGRGWLVAGGSFATAAFFTKFTSFYVLPWMVWRLVRQGAYGLAGWLGIAVSLACATGICLLEWFTAGRFTQNMGATLTAGASMDHLLGSARVLWLNVSAEDPTTLILLLVTLPSALLSCLVWELRLEWKRCPHQERAQVLELSPPPGWEGALLVWTWAVTWFIFTSPGTWMNHLVDPLAASLLVLGPFFGSSAARWAGAGCVAFCVAHLVTWLPDCPSIQATLRKDGIMLRQTLTQIDHEFQLRGRPFYAENNTVAIALGQRPFSLDEFSLRLFLRNNHPVGRDFERRARAQYFDYIILESVPFKSNVDRPDDPVLATCRDDYWRSQPLEYQCLRPYYQVVAVRLPLAILGRRTVRRDWPNSSPEIQVRKNN